MACSCNESQKCAKEFTNFVSIFMSKGMRKEKKII
jgi:hypothetical protein